MGCVDIDTTFVVEGNEPMINDTSFLLVSIFFLIFFCTSLFLILELDYDSPKYQSLV